MIDYVAMAEMIRGWVEEAGDILRESLADNSIKVEEKTNPSDLVTEMDRFIEKFYVQKIQEHFPDHKILGEEGTYDTFEDLKGFIWVIDPIDGTLNYVKQKRNFCSMLAVFKDGEPVLSFINDVIHEELYEGVKGHGVRCNGHLMEPIAEHPISEGLVSINTRMEMRDPERARSIVGDSLGVRLMGSSGLEMVQVISNRISAYVTTPLSFWDVAPGMAMAAELGLKMTRPDGEPIKLLENNPIIIANPMAYEQIIGKFSN